MRYYSIVTLLVLVCLLPALGHADGTIITVPDPDRPYLLKLDRALETLTSAAQECRSNDAELAPCLCDESEALKGMESALSSVLEDRPNWEDKAVQNGGLLIQVPSLQKQVDSIRAKCGD